MERYEVSGVSLATNTVGTLGRVIWRKGTAFSLYFVNGVVYTLISKYSVWCYNTDTSRKFKQGSLNISLPFKRGNSFTTNTESCILYVSFSSREGCKTFIHRDWYNTSSLED